MHNVTKPVEISRSPITFLLLDKLFEVAANWDRSFQRQTNLGRDEVEKSLLRAKCDKDLFLQIWRHLIRN